MNRVMTLMLCALMLTSCGIKRPLIAPADIPDYEASERRRHQQLTDQQSDIDRANAAKAATTEGNK